MFVAFFCVNKIITFVKLNGTVIESHMKGTIITIVPRSIFILELFSLRLNQFNEKSGHLYKNTKHVVSAFNISHTNSFYCIHSVH